MEIQTRQIHFPGKYTQRGDPTPFAEELKTNHNVELFSIAIGTKEDTNAFRVMEKLASKTDGQQHFFAVDKKWNMWSTINKMITRKI